MDHPSEEQIRAQAHRLWEAAGCPENREQEFWYQAERDLKGTASETSSNAGPDEKSDTFLE
jgi:Protein of unknown function (DUF2934)